jgi:DNA-binding transcriptional LysR family regulator
MKCSEARGVDGDAIDIAQIRYFLFATEYLNYTRAATALGVCSSTISRHIRRIEDNLGISLFERHRNGLRLTAAGRQFHARAEQFMFEFGRAVENAARAGRAEIGDLHIGVAPCVLTGPLQKFQLYRCALPDVEIRCFEGEDASQNLALREHRVDVAVGYADLRGDSGVRVMPLWHEALYLALSKQHLLARRRFVTWRQFKIQNIVVRGWSMSAEMTAQLVTDALVMAIWRRGKLDALLHHSDRGSQYTSEPFQRLMADNGVVCSMSRSGNVWDNAAMESFFSSLKTERIRHKIYRPRDEARADVFDYIERFYNPKRRHSTIGYLSPVAFEMQAGVA